jgi:antitoxin (DNA-binding transcriptional repressor) of toxin-antitoxin stability system
LASDTAELRAVLAGVPVQVGPAPAATLPPLDALQAEARELRAALSAVIADLPDEDHPVRKQAREYLARHLEREAEWQQDAYTGPRR